MSKKLEHVHFSSIVHLDIGGHCFKTSAQTLTNDPNTKLAAIGSGKITPCEDGVFFFDRDGTYFRFILNYLRDGKLILPEGATFREELQAEAEYYGIQGIIDELRASEPTVQASKPAKTFEESVLLTNENHQSVLKGWLPSQEGKWRLLYRASRDGFAAAAFHSKCDNKGPTVTVVKSGNNIFGGFTEVSWSSGKFPDFTGRFPFDQIFRFEIPGIPCNEWNSNFPVRSINQSQAIGFQVSRENTRSNERLFYRSLLALGLLNDSEVR